MEKEKRLKYITMTALVLALLGLSLGLAAFSKVLTILPSAYISPSSDNFQIYISNDPNMVSSDSVAITNVTSTEGATAGTASLINYDSNRNNNPTITGIHANFTKPGQKVTYRFYVVNKGKYDAYLNNITFENVNGKKSPKVCIPHAETTNKENVSSACENINISVKVGNDLPTYGSIPEISNHKLLQAKYEEIELTIAYDDTGIEINEKFDVSFGNIKLDYSTLD